MSLAWGVAGIAAAWLGFAYVGYPLTLYLLARFAPHPLLRGDVTPPLSLILAVHDGADELAAKLDNTLACSYAGERQVIVASDGSSDGTEALARSYADRGVELVVLPERRGKEAAQAAAIGRATGEILVFSDLSARLEPDALTAIVRPFADPAVGCVSSEDVVEGGSGESAYVRLEMALRQWESEAASLVGLSGSFFATRRALADPWPDDLASDFRTALEAGRRGLRAVSEPAARARFGVTGDAAAEWARKVRTVRRGLAVLFRYRALLDPRRGRLALAVWGHKLARFTSPFALVALLVASAAAAATSALAAALLAAQLAAYAAGLWALARPSDGIGRLPRLAGYFLLVNASMLVAWAYHVSGRRAVTWVPTRR